MKKKNASVMTDFSGMVLLMVVNQLQMTVKQHARKNTPKITNAAFLKMVSNKKCIFNFFCNFMSTKIGQLIAFMQQIAIRATSFLFWDQLFFKFRLHNRKFKYSYILKHVFDPIFESLL